MNALTAHAGRGIHRLIRAAWSELPLWLAASAVVCVAATLAALLTPGVTPFSVLLASGLVAAPVGALVAALLAVVRDDDAPWAVWRLALRRGAAVIADCVPAALATALLVVAIEVWHLSGEPVVLGSVGVSGAVTLLAWTVTAARIPLRYDRPDLRGGQAWRTALALAAASPARFLTAPLLLAAGVWSAVHLAASLLLLVPLPVALVAVAAYWSTACEVGLASDDRELQQDKEFAA